MDKNQFLKAFKSAYMQISKDMPTEVHPFIKQSLYRFTIIHLIEKQGWIGKQRQSFIEGWLSQFDNSVPFDGLIDMFTSFSTEGGCVINGYTIPFLNINIFRRNEFDDAAYWPDLSISKINLISFLDMLDVADIKFTDNVSDEDDITLEVLGFVFENMLVDRKEKGAYYTPVQIVNYMCRESLIQSIKANADKVYKVYSVKDGVITLEDGTVSNEIGDDWINVDLIQNLIHKFDVGTLTEMQLKLIFTIITNININDPAVGSGAFPIGMLYNMTEVQAAILDELGYDYNRHELKISNIEKCLTGVDIDAGAIEVCKLRMGLSILSECKEPIVLPNMDFRFLVGNSLIPVHNGKIINIEWPVNDGNSFFQFDKKDVKEDVEKLIEMKSLFFHKKNGIFAAKNEILEYRNWLLEKIGYKVEGDINGNISFDWKLDFPEVFNPHK